MSSWSTVLSGLIAREQLPVGDLHWAMEQMMSGDASPSQISAFLTALRAKGETPTDVSALVDVMLEHAVPAPVSGITVDTCGTGGDGAHTVNISTMAAIVVAALDVTVIKHGNRAASSKCGSADVLAELGVPLDIDPAKAVDVANNVGITFLFAQAFHPALRHVGPTRREIGIPTVFNILGPLANPARPTAQVVGVANAAIAPMIAEVLRVRGTRALVVRGHDGLDELSIATSSTMWSVLGDEVVEIIFDPRTLGIAVPSEDALLGGDAAFNADVARRLFAGEVSGKFEHIRDAVCLNAAAALVAVEAVSTPHLNVHESLQAKFELAKSAVADGAAQAKLEQWIAALS
ncbi:MAG: anthranilate phosphoribosyltransferase [Actinomycetota bacterium]